MKQTTIPMRADSKIVIRCSADLSVEGIDAVTMIVVVDQGDTLRMKEENGLFQLSANSDCRVLLPGTVTVTIEKVSGDASISNLSSRLIVGKVNGDLSIRQIGGATIESVSGDFSIHQSTGAVEIARVAGDLHADGLVSLSAGAISGDAHLVGIDGKVELSTDGDAEIKMTNPTLPEVIVKASGDIRFVVLPNAKGQLEINSGGEDISVHVGDQIADLEETQTSLPLGEGGALVELNAGGEIVVTDQDETDWDFDDESDAMENQWKDFGIEIEQKVKESLEQARETLKNSTRMMGFGGKIAQEKMEKAINRLEARGINPGRKRKIIGFTVGDTDPFRPESPASAGPSDEERLIVLRMLQEKKISVEEAEKLLNALER
jgi:hypothetical protein